MRKKSDSNKLNIYKSKCNVNQKKEYIQSNEYLDDIELMEKGEKRVHRLSEHIEDY